MTHDNVTDIVEQLRAWEPLVSDGYECPAAGQSMHEAAAIIEAQQADLATLRKQLENAREALRVIAEGDEPRPIGLPWRNDGKPSKHDRCKHGAWMYNGCEECTATFAAEALKGQP